MPQGTVIARPFFNEYYIKLYFQYAECLHLAVNFPREEMIISWLSYWACGDISIQITKTPNYCATNHAMCYNNQNKWKMYSGIWHTLPNRKPFPCIFKSVLMYVWKRHTAAYWSWQRKLGDHRGFFSEAEYI